MGRRPFPPTNAADRDARAIRTALLPVIRPDVHPGDTGADDLLAARRVILEAYGRGPDHMTSVVENMVAELVGVMDGLCCLMLAEHSGRNGHDPDVAAEAAAMTVDLLSRVSLAAAVDDAEDAG